MAPRMPGEYEPHERTVMCWPARHDLWRHHIGDAEAAYAEVAAAIAAFEPVTMIAAPGAAERAAQRCGDKVDVVELPIDDSWFRDSGPTYVFDEGELIAVDWVFNSWGERYLPYAADAAIAARWAASAGHATRQVPLVLEGGSITVDGEGTLVTTEQCLLHPNRNPSMTRTEISAALGEQLGVSTVVWLPHGLALDGDTDGHVDNVAAFARPGVLLVQGCDDPGEEDWLRCNVNARCARGTVDAAGRPLEVIEVPVLPFTVYGGERVVVPYLNFSLVNGGVIVPTCGHRADTEMLAVIADQFPGREVVGIDVGAVLAHGGGGIHCITQQMPRSGSAMRPE